MFFNFHTHKTCENALVSAGENPGCSCWSLEKHPWYLPEKFISPDETDSPSYGIIHENDAPNALITENNLFIGKIDKEVITVKQAENS